MKYLHRKYLQTVTSSRILIMVNETKMYLIVKVTD